MEVGQLCPFFAKGSLLLLEPIGGLLVFPMDPLKPRERRTFELNPLAVEVAKRCNGLRTCVEIISEIDNLVKGGGFDVPGTTASFLAELGRMGILRFQDKSKGQPIVMSGSTEHFTPVHFSIELTDHCNLLCKHCYRESGPHLNNFLPTKKLLSLFDIMSSHGVQTIELTGGEPMTHPDFTQIFRKASEVFGTVGIVSNGTLIDDEAIAAFSRASERVVVQIDVDGDTAQVHDSLRGIPGAFARVLGAARKLWSHGILFRVVMNAYPGNMHRVRQTAALAQQLGAFQFAFAPILRIGRGVGIPELTENQAEGLLNLTTELESSYPGFVKVRTEVPDDLYFQKKGNCGAGSRSLVLGPSGNVRPCLMLGEEYGIFGNLLEEDYQTLVLRSPLSANYGIQLPNEVICEGCYYTRFCYGCFTRPFHAREHSYHRKMPFYCTWNEKTGYLDLMKQLEPHSD